MTFHCLYWFLSITYNMCESLVYNTCVLHIYYNLIVFNLEYFFWITKKHQFNYKILENMCVFMYVYTWVYEDKYFTYKFCP